MPSCWQNIIVRTRWNAASSAFYIRPEDAVVSLKKSVMKQEMLKEKETHFRVRTTIFSQQLGIGVCCISNTFFVTPYRDHRYVCIYLYIVVSISMVGTNMAKLTTGFFFNGNWNGFCQNPDACRDVNLGVFDLWLWHRSPVRVRRGCDSFFISSSYVTTGCVVVYSYLIDRCMEASRLCDIGCFTSVRRSFVACNRTAIDSFMSCQRYSRWMRYKLPIGATVDFYSKPLSSCMRRVAVVDVHSKSVVSKLITELASNQSSLITRYYYGTLSKSGTRSCETFDLTVCAVLWNLRIDTAHSFKKPASDDVRNF